MNPITVQLTDIEAKAIIQFVEFGIRQNGSQAARIGLPIQDKVALAIDAASKTQPTPAPIGLPIQDKVALAIDAASKTQPTPALTNAGGDITQP